MSNNPLSLTVVDGEPRVYDLDLAERLGFDRPLNIRNLIKRNMDKLLKFGVLSTVEKTSGDLGGRPTFAYYPNQKQSVWLCMKSETERAFDVQVEIVRVFDAYLTGDLKPTMPQSYAEALRLYADQVERNEQQQREIEASRPKVAFHDQVVSSETLIDFTEAFSLLQRRTGQRFTRRTFLDFCRRHGIACQPNPHAGIGADRFVPRKDYVGTWFVSEMHPNGVTEWMLRPLAIAGIVQLIEMDRQQALMTPRRLPRRLDDDQEAA